jgi:alpha-beta hydrolase superfamily lysophospholipase
MIGFKKILTIGILSFLVTIYSCSSMKNLERPKVSSADKGHFFTTKNGCQLYMYVYQPIGNYQVTIFIISGITGINHNAEKDMIEQLCNDKNKVVIIHPRGTGYSEGKRGDISNFSDFTNDYIEIIKSDNDYISKQHKIILFGHSMSTAVLLAVADKIQNIGGVILVNPPYIVKKAKGMSPSLGQYFKYAWFYLLKKHKPIVNMAGDPTVIENEEDRKESELRINDPLLVKYFSIYMMTKSRNLMKSMLDYAKIANYPVLVIYGEKDNIVDKKGCDMIYENWKHPNKQYVLVENGTHGKSTVTLAKDNINKWIENN